MRKWLMVAFLTCAVSAVNAAGITQQQLAGAVAQINRGAPYQLGNGVSMVKAIALPGLMLSYTHVTTFRRTSVMAQAMALAQQADVAQESCNEYADLLRAGVTIRAVYYDPQGEFIMKATVRDSDCH